jgi:hypothetical protein
MALGLLGLMALPLAATKASGDPITFRVEGTIAAASLATSDLIQVGDPFRIEYTFEATTPDACDLVPPPNSRCFEDFLGDYQNAIKNMTVVVGAINVSLSLNSELRRTSINLWNGEQRNTVLDQYHAGVRIWPGAVTYRLTNVISGMNVIPSMNFDLERIVVKLEQPTSANSLTATDLPLRPPDLQAFAETNVVIGLNADLFPFFFGGNGVITSFVPEPTQTLSLACSLLAVLAIARRCRRYGA